jgi:hypothetical protein
VFDHQEPSPTAERDHRAWVEAFALASHEPPPGEQHQSRRRRRFRPIVSK